MLQDLPLKHLDEQLHPWRELPYLRPRAGWLRAIREALGMTVRQFAKAAGTAPSTAQAAERAEAKGDISLSTLTRYADALGCELRYVLVPRKPLRQTKCSRSRPRKSLLQHLPPLTQSRLIPSYSYGDRCGGPRPGSSFSRPRSDC